MTDESEKLEIALLLIETGARRAMEPLMRSLIENMAQLLKLGQEQELYFENNVYRQAFESAETAIRALEAQRDELLGVLEEAGREFNPKAAVANIVALECFALAADEFTRERIRFCLGRLLDHSHESIRFRAAEALRKIS